MATTNVSATATEQVVFFHLYEKVIMLTVLVVVALTGIVGNSLTCVIFVQNKSLRTSANFLIVSLAVADVLQSLNMIFIVVSIVSDGWVLGNALCQLCGWTNMSFIITSIVNLALISLHRYFAVVKKRSKRMFTKKNTLLLIAFSWVYPAIFSIAPVIGWAKYKYRPGKLMCTLQFSESISYTLTMMCVAIFMPFAIMCYATYRIVKEVKQSRSRVAHSTSAVQQSRRYEMRISIMLISIVVFFFVFYSPASTVNMVQLGLGNEYIMPYRLDAWSVIMAMFNHANNPIIYSIMNPNFRKGFNVLCSKEKRKQFHTAMEIEARQTLPTQDQNQSKPEVNA